MKATIIAEIGSNWEGDLRKGRKLIRESKKAGADLVKFQMWRATDLYSKKHPNWNIIKKSELTFEKAKKLKKFADKLGIEFFCSAFYPEAVEFLESLKVKRYKVASRTCLLKDPYSLETLKAKSSTKKPIIFSMGMGGNIKRIKNIFTKNKTTFCYCISKYPLGFNEINWKKAVKYNGFSDHTMGIIAPIVYAILKKQQNATSIMIEKHVKLKESTGPDAATSIDTEQLKELVEYINLIKSSKLS